MESKATLSLCMIVKNEEAFLEDCLKQARPYCDEIIVVDTGSVDSSKTIANNCGAKVIDYTWSHDFSAARNASLQHATGDWIIVLDADERLTPNDWQKIVTAIQEPQSAANLALAQVNYTFESALVGFKPNHFAVPGFTSYPGYMLSWITRLFKNDGSFDFSGVVHENLTRHGQILHSEHLPVFLHHHGQVLSKEKLQAKKQQYFELGKSKVAQNPNDGKAHYELGVCAWEAGDPVGAAQSFATSDSLRPNDVKNLIAWAAVLKLSGDLKASEEKFRSVLSLQPDEPSAHAGLAGCLKAQGRFDDALIELQKQIKINPDFPVARQWLSDCYDDKAKADPNSKATITVCYIVKNEADCLSKTLENVRPHVDEIIVLDTGSTDESIAIARKYGAAVYATEWRDDFSFARNQSMKYATSEWILILDADEVISADDWPRIKALIAARQNLMYYLVQTTYSNIATVLHWQQNQLDLPESAGYRGYFESPLVRLFRNTPQIAFRGSVHEHAHHVDAHVHPVMTLLRIHHYGKHRSDERMREKSDLYYKIGQKKITEMPNEPHAYFELAAQLMELGEIENVEANFRKALELDPNHVDALLALASFLSERERYADALDLFARLIQLKPEDPQAYIFTSSVLISLKKYDLAKSLLATAKNLGATDNIALLMNEGVIALHLNDFARAHDIFCHAHRLNASFAPVLLNLGVALMSLQRNAEAQEYLRQAILLDPDNDTAYQKCAEALFNAGDRESSLELFIKAYTLNPKNTGFISQIIINAHALGRLDVVQTYEDKLFTLVKSQNNKSMTEAAVLRVAELYKIKNDADGMKRVSSFVESLT